MSRARQANLAFLSFLLGSLGAAILCIALKILCSLLSWLISASSNMSYDGLYAALTGWMEILWVYPALIAIGSFAVFFAARYLLETKANLKFLQRAF